MSRLTLVQVTCLYMQWSRTNISTTLFDHWGHKWDLAKMDSSMDDPWRGCYLGCYFSLSVEHLNKAGLKHCDKKRGSAVVRCVIHGILHGAHWAHWVILTRWLKLLWRSSLYRQVSGDFNRLDWFPIETKRNGMRKERTKKIYVFLNVAQHWLSKQWPGNLHSAGGLERPPPWVSVSIACFIPTSHRINLLSAVEDGVRIKVSDRLNQ